mgnify:CR=1 FL=1
MQKKCTICGALFESHHGIEVCSESCRLERKRISDIKSNARRKNHESDIPILKKCPVCGKEFETFRNKYCSKECTEIVRKKNLRLYSKYYYKKERINKYGKYALRTYQ